MTPALTQQIAFYILAAMTIGSAILVVTMNNIMRAAFALLFCLSGVAGLYALLAADFLAVAQLLIYVGGILVLILFGVMLTQRITGVRIFAPAAQVVPAAVVSAALAAVLLWTIWTWHPAPRHIPPPESTSMRIGDLLLTQYLLPFEAVSVLLLVALVGAAFLARREVKE